MLRAIYSITLAFWAIIQWPRLVYKKYKNPALKADAFTKLFPKLPILSNKKKVFWIHAVSLGETKAVSKLLIEIKKEYPDSVIVFSNTTDTGHFQAIKYPQVDHAIFLPLDFSWIMKRLVKAIHPEVFIMVESDYWLNLLTYLKKNNVKTAIVNGKISKKSFLRFKKASLFSKALFSQIDTFCLQNDLYKKRFLSLDIPEEKIQITGNIKYDIEEKIYSTKEIHELKRRHLLSDKDVVIAFSCTHKSEEDLLFTEVEEILQKVGHAKIFIAPRHPERFSAAYEKFALKAFKFSVNQGFSEETPICIIDQIGVLSEVYALCDIVVLAGSFVPAIGGHNLFEPLQSDVALIFGPYTDAQKEMTDLILNAEAGLQVKAKELSFSIQRLVNKPEEKGLLRQNAKALLDNGKGASKRTWQILQKAIAE